MLENIPHWLGAALGNVRAGHNKLTVTRLGLAEVPAIDFGSPAFAAGGRLPVRFTADGEGVSPPLGWGAVPDATASLALIVEDPDAPTPRPLVHAIVFDIAPDRSSLAEGEIAADGPGSDGKNVGRSSALSEGWLPPDPPTGHGVHDYVFQLLALGPGAPVADDNPGRGDFIDHVRGRILAAGVLTGTYSREEAAPAGPVGSVAPA